MQPVAAQTWDREFWLDQRVSISLNPESFVLLRFSERANKSISLLFENFVEIDAGFHVQTRLTNDLASTRAPIASVGIGFKKEFRFP